MRENAPHRNGVGKSENEGKKMCEKKRCDDQKNDNFCNMQS